MKDLLQNTTGGQSDVNESTRRLCRVVGSDNVFSGMLGGRNAGAQSNGEGRQMNTHEMVFLMGTPAAGKSTIANKLFGDTHVFIDCDLIKQTHPAYDPKNPAPLHAWSAAEADRIFQSACEVASGNWVIDGTGSNAEAMVTDIKAARNAGFAIKLVYVKCRLETSLLRNARRERTVPTEIVIEKARTIATSFEIVSAYVDEVTVIDNDMERAN